MSLLPKEEIKWGIKEYFILIGIFSILCGLFYIYKLVADIFTSFKLQVKDVKEEKKIKNKKVNSSKKKIKK